MLQDVFDCERNKREWKYPQESTIPCFSFAPKCRTSQILCSSCCYSASNNCCKENLSPAETSPCSSATDEEHQSVSSCAIPNFDCSLESVLQSVKIGEPLWMIWGKTSGCWLIVMIMLIMTVWDDVLPSMAYDKQTVSFSCHTIAVKISHAVHSNCRI